MKCGTITHSANKTRQRKEKWGWGLEMTGKGRGGQNLKKRGGVGNIWGVVHNIWGFRTSLPTMALQKRFIK